jgi:hypothetical protein
MAGLGGNRDATTEVTGNRKTIVRFDVTEPTTSEPPFAATRNGSEMARGGLTTNNSLNMTRLANGAIGLTPYQKTLTNQTAQTDVGSSIIALNQFTTINGYVERPHYRGPSYLTGITLAAGTLASGNNMAEKTIPAAQAGGWNQSLTADKAAFPQPPIPNVLTVIDRHAISNVSYADNQAFTFRHRMPTGAAYYGPSHVFYFGGPVNSNGNGQYGFSFEGHYITLYEYSAAAGGWVIVDDWRYLTGVNPGEEVTLHVRPFRSPRGNLMIEFEGTTQANAANSGNSGSLNMQIRSAPQGLTTHLFKVNTHPSAPAAPPSTPAMPAPVRTKVTGTGPLRVDMARELRIPWQISVWRYFATGSFNDYALMMPWHATTRGLITLYWTATVPAGATFIARLMDTTTGTELTPAGTNGAGYKQYRVNAGQPSYYARFEFTAGPGQASTPMLFDYAVQKDAVIGQSAPGEFSTPTTYPGAKVRNINISGPEADPSHETASCKISDLTNSLTVLNRRASVRTRIETQYDPANSAKRSVLFDGYLQKAPAARRGSVGNVGAGGGGAAKLYPSPLWRDFECNFTGMWTRLHKTLTMFRLDLQKPDRNAAVDPVTGIAPPLKVTDICRALLGYAGFPANMIDVPDSPIRFFPGGTENGNSLMIDPLSNVAEAVVRFAKDYLGWFLIWDGNAGTNGGMWRLRPPVPVQGPYTNLATFTLDGPAAGKLVTSSGSYGSTAGKSWVGVNPTVFIRKGTMTTFVKPPEGNAVCVTGSGRLLPDDGQFIVTNWVCNPKSYDFFVDGSGNPIVTSDPTNPDYLGHFAPIVIVNFGLGDEVHGQHLVDIVCRRTYDVSCHGIKMLSFIAPLALITDPADTNQTNPRPLRYYDPVGVVEGGVTTQWLVRNCNPQYVKDSVQMAYYELEAPRTD